MEEDEDEFDGENQEDGDTTESGEPSIGGSSDLPCSIDGLPLVVDQIKLMGFKNECSSVSNINTGSSTSISMWNLHYKGNLGFVLLKRLFLLCFLFGVSIKRGSTV